MDTGSRIVALEREVRALQAALRAVQAGWAVRVALDAAAAQEVDAYAKSAEAVDCDARWDTLRRDGG